MAKPHHRRLSSLLGIFFSAAAFVVVVDASNSSIVRINEIAHRGSDKTVCDGEDWIELLNSGETAANLTNYVLHDDKGRDHEDATILNAVAVLDPGKFLVLCRGQDFGFGIGSGDAVTLVDATGVVVDSVMLPENEAGGEAETYALFDGDGNIFRYTATPTPGKENVYTEPISVEERLAAQNDVANDFFKVNGNDDDDAIFGRVVDLFVSLDVESLAILEDHPAWEEYVPFYRISVSNSRDAATERVSNRTFAAVSGRGRIRTKGQWSKSMTACLGLSNVPFHIDFGDEPFLGMETLYLRNAMDDPSYMRDHSSHTMLRAFGLPYLRTRPARLFLNGKYVGFYTLMEAPTQGYVMQRSFGAFEPEKTALFKAKTSMKDCPFEILYNNGTTTDDNDEDLPDPFYFERGRHREDIPVLGFEGYGECIDHYSQERGKEHADEAKGYYHAYDQNCGLATVKMGIVDRDFGPESMESPMVDFLEHSFYNQSVHDLTDSVDIDQWLHNIAVYAIVINMDSPMGIVNNWYLASTNGGWNDWKIVQYDHHGVTAKSMVNFGCDSSCGPKMVHWPILRPTCGPVEDHTIVGRILNSPERIKKYLQYVKEYVDVLADDRILDQLYGYGHSIKDYIVDDPWFQHQSVVDYEESELGTDVRDYDENDSSYLKTLTVRLQQVREQLDAIDDGSLPLDESYPLDALCPDWRDGVGLEGGREQDSSTTTTTNNNTNENISNVSSGVSHSPWTTTIAYLLASLAVTMTS